MANLSDPVIDSSISSLVIKVGGVNTLGTKSLIARAKNPVTQKPMKTLVTDARKKPPTFKRSCLSAPQTVSFSTAGSAPTATYTGNVYHAPIANEETECAYTPADLQKAYGLNHLYDLNLKGAGQTIAIVDSYGSPTLDRDLTLFTSAYHLPPVSLAVYRMNAQTVVGPWTSEQQEWAMETDLDVEYVHAVAPEAQIALILAEDTDDEKLAGISYILENNLAHVISNSWSVAEASVDTTTKALYDTVLQSAAVRGVAVNFATGDNGDVDGVRGYIDTEFPADSPYVTAVGGTSLFVKDDGSLDFQTAWGTNLTPIAGPDSTGKIIPSAPQYAIAYEGSGGGVSRIFPKPNFQWAIAGQNRMIPDISYLGDPFTGVPIFTTTFDSNGNVVADKLTTTTVGGTSLPTPMFSALWAIVNEAAGRSMGQAAPLLYALSPSAINDVVPHGSDHNVLGTFVGADGTTTALSALQLAGPDTNSPFISVLFSASQHTYVIAFGTDTSLAAAPGWDNATGLGTPNALEFVYELSRIARR